MKTFAFTATAVLLLSACASTVMPVVTEHGPTMLSSQSSFTKTESKLRSALNKRDLKLFEVVDHGQGAKSVGQDIGQNKLFIFGNPKSGTPLMVENRLAAFDLPMKVLIYEDEAGDVWIVNTDIEAMAKEYMITEQDDRIDKIKRTLTAIVQETAY